MYNTINSRSRFGILFVMFLIIAASMFLNSTCFSQVSSAVNNKNLKQEALDNADEKNQYKTGCWISGTFYGLHFIVSTWFIISLMKALKRERAARVKYLEDALAKSIKAKGK